MGPVRDPDQTCVCPMTLKLYTTLWGRSQGRLTLFFLIFRPLSYLHADDAADAFCVSPSPGNREGISRGARRPLLKSVHTRSAASRDSRQAMGIADDRAEGGVPQGWKRPGRGVRRPLLSPALRHTPVE